jgi:hypothetical protein
MPLLVSDANIFIDFEVGELLDRSRLESILFF